MKYIIASLAFGACLADAPRLERPCRTARCKLWIRWGNLLSVALPARPIRPEQMVRHSRRTPPRALLRRIMLEAEPIQPHLPHIQIAPRLYRSTISLA